MDKCSTSDRGNQQLREDQFEEFPPAGPNNKNQIASRGLTIIKIAIRDKFKGNEEMAVKCAICVANYEKKKIFLKLNCDYDFHYGCIFKWMKEKKTCSLCREVCRRDP